MTNQVQTGQNVVGRWRVGRRIAGAIKFLFNARDLHLECARVLPKTLLVPVLMYNIETMLWKEEERSIIRAVQMDKIRGLLGIRRMDRVPNERIKRVVWSDERGR